MVSALSTRDYSRLEATAFARGRLAGLSAIVVGAGALGNEVLKNLALLGIGRVTIVDRDGVERSNLTRSILFCSDDIEGHLERRTPKAAFAADAVTRINPDVRAHAHVGDVADLGLGRLRRADLVFACLDNEMARMELGWACLRANRPLVDGGLGNLNPSSGLVLFFPGAEGPCGICRKSAERRRELLWELQGRQDPCWLKERLHAREEAVATTPLMASAVAALQVEIGLRAALDARDGTASAAPAASTASGRAYRITFHPRPRLDMRTFDVSPNCPFHDPDTVLRTVHERADRRSSQWTAGELLGEMAPESVLQLDWPITADAACRACGHAWMPRVRRARFRGTACPRCASVDVAETRVIEVVEAGSPDAALSLEALGLPAWHVHDLVSRTDGTRTYVEVTGDAEEPC